MRNFSLGQLVYTPAAMGFMLTNNIDMFALLARHKTGDWSDMSEEDQKSNEEATNPDFPSRVFSSYSYRAGKVWVITEWDRSATTILLPSDY